MDINPPRVAIVDPVHPWLIPAMVGRYSVIECLRPDDVALCDLLGSVEAIILRSGVRLMEAHLEKAPKLRFIARAGVGTDNIDLGYASRRGIIVFNVPDLSAISVAEFTVGALLAVTRKISLADRQIRDGRWSKAELCGTELAGLTLGVVGLGRIGTHVARIASGFGMRIIASVAQPSPERQRASAQVGVRLTSNERILKEADVVCLHCPLTPATKNLIDGWAIATMRPGAFIINMSRGGVVDEDALYDALRDGRLAGLATDVLKEERRHSPLFALDNVVATPHIGAMTDAAQRRIAEVLLADLDRGFAGEPLVNRVA